MLCTLILGSSRGRTLFEAHEPPAGASLVEESCVREYFFSPHVHHCHTQDGIVLLDLRRQRYFSMGEAQLKLLGSLVQGWNGIRGTKEPTSPVTETTGIEFAEYLVDKEILTRERESHSATPSLKMPERTAVEAIIHKACTISALDVLHFTVAFFSATLALKFLSLERIVCAVRKRKLRAQRIISEDHIVMLTRRFYSLRPFLYTSHDACLKDSFVLLKFLASYGYYPQWAMGIETQPFEAHSWVQHDNMVLNDTAEHARKFVPILVV
jgi:Transglutaminase-like superfamily